MVTVSSRLLVAMCLWQCVAAASTTPSTEDLDGQRFSRSSLTQRMVTRNSTKRMVARNSTERVVTTTTEYYRLQAAGFYLHVLQNGSVLGSNLVDVYGVMRIVQFRRTKDHQTRTSHVTIKGVVSGFYVCLNRHKGVFTSERVRRNCRLTVGSNGKIYTFYRKAKSSSTYLHLAVHRSKGEAGVQSLVRHSDFKSGKNARDAASRKRRRSKKRGRQRRKRTRQLNKRGRRHRRHFRSQRHLTRRKHRRAAKRQTKKRKDRRLEKLMPLDHQFHMFNVTDTEMWTAVARAHRTRAAVMGDDELLETTTSSSAIMELE